MSAKPKKPEHVWCANCCYWDGSEDTGLCFRFPRHWIHTVRSDQWPQTEPFDFCGEFRRTWPEEAPCSE